MWRTGAAAVLTLALTLGGFIAAPISVGVQGAIVERSVGCGYGAKVLHVTTPYGNNLVVCQGDVTAPAETVVFHPPMNCSSFGEVTNTTTIVISRGGRQSVVCRFNPSGQ